MKLTIGTLVLVGTCLAAQQITLVPPSEIASQRKLLELAWQQWEASDAGLERSLFSEPVERVLARIERGRRHAIAYHQQRAKFLETLLSALRRELTLFEDDEGEVAPALLAPDARKLDVLLEEQKRLEGKARTVGASLLEQRSLAEQSSLLRQLAENLGAQQALYRAFREGEEHHRKVRRALVDSYRNILQLVEDQLRLNEEKRQLWLDYYDSLRELVEARQPATTKASRPKERK